MDEARATPPTPGKEAAISDEALVDLIDAQLETMRSLEHSTIDLLLKTIAAFALASGALTFGPARLKVPGRIAAVILVAVFTVAVVTWLIDRQRGFQKRKRHLHL